MGILSYTDSWCSVPISSNISCDHTHKVSLFWLQYQEQCHILVMQRGTQQENSSMKYAVIIRLPVTATLSRVNEASHWNVLTKYWDERTA